MFEYAFMRRAFAVGLLLGIIMPCIGVMIVLKRLSMLGDALSHTSLAGVAAGLLLDIDPVLGATTACVAAAFGIEVIRKKIPQYAELSIAVMLSAGVGLAGVLSGFVQNAAGFNSFLFGSIVAITPGELTATAVISVLVLTAFVLLYKELFAIALDEHAARRAGVPVGAVNSIYTILTAATVSVAARTVGALIVSSMLVARSYKQTVLFSILFAEGFIAAGLTLAFYAGLKPGGTIVLLGVGCLLVILAGKTAAAHFSRRKRDVK